MAGNAVDPGLSARGTSDRPRATESSSSDLFLLYRSSVEQLIERVRETIQEYVTYYDEGGNHFCASCHSWLPHRPSCLIPKLRSAMDHVIGIRQELEDHEKEMARMDSPAMPRDDCRTASTD